MERQSKLPFEVGQEVEARFNLSGYRGAWFRCRIQDIKDSKGGVSCLLEYLDFDEASTWSRARQADPAAKSEAWLKGKKSLIWMIRPSAPPVIEEGDLEKYQEAVRKNQKEAGVVAIVNNQFMVGDMVEWCVDKCFWTGRIVKVFKNNKVKLVLPPPPTGQGSTYSVFTKDLRPAFSWSLKNQWRLVPTRVSRGGSDGKTLCDKPRTRLVHLSGYSICPPAVQQSLNSGGLPTSSRSRGPSPHSGDRAQEVMSQSQCTPGEQTQNNNNDLVDLVGTWSSPDSSRKSDSPVKRKHMKMKARKGVALPSVTNQVVHMEGGRRKNVCKTASFCLSDSDEEDTKELVVQQKLPLLTEELENGDKVHTYIVLEDDSPGSRTFMSRSRRVVTEQQLHKESTINSGSTIAGLHVSSTSLIDEPQVEIIIGGETTSRFDDTESPCSTHVNAEDPGNEVLITTSAMDHEDEVQVESVVTSESTAGLENMEIPRSTAENARVPCVGVAEVREITDVMDDEAEPQVEIAIAGQTTAGNSESPCSGPPDRAIETLADVQLTEQQQKGDVGAERRRKLLMGRGNCQTVRKAIRDSFRRKRGRATCEEASVEPKRMWRACRSESEDRNDPGAVRHDGNVGDGFMQDAVPSSAPSTPVYGENRDSIPGSRTKWDLLTDEQENRVPVTEDPQLVVTLQIEPWSDGLDQLGGEEDDFGAHMHSEAQEKTPELSEPQNVEECYLIVDLDIDDMSGKDALAAATHQLKLTSVEEPRTFLPTRPESSEERMPMEVDNASLAAPSSKEPLCQAYGTAEGPAEKAPCNDDDLGTQLDALERLTERIYELKLQLQGCRVQKRRKKGGWKVVDRNTTALGVGEEASMQGSIPKGKVRNLGETSKAATCGDSASGVEKCFTRSGPTRGVQGASQEGPMTEAVQKKVSADPQTSMERTSMKPSVPTTGGMKRLESSENTKRTKAKVRSRPEAGDSKASIPETVDGSLGAPVLHEVPVKQVRALKVGAKSTAKKKGGVKRKRAAEKNVEVDGRKKGTIEIKAPTDVVPEDVVEYPCADVELPRMRGSLRKPKEKLTTMRSQSSHKRSAQRKSQEPGLGKKGKNKEMALIRDPVAFEQQRLKERSFTGHEKQVFWEKFAINGKKFRIIASHLENRSTGDCVEFYYQNKLPNVAVIEGQAQTDQRFNRRLSRRNLGSKKEYLVRPVPECHRHLEANAVRAEALPLPSVDTGEIIKVKRAKITDKGLEHVVQHGQKPSTGVSNSGPEMKIQPSSASKQKEPALGPSKTGHTGSELVQDETEQHKIKLQPNGNWCIKAESEGKPVWIGSYRTKEAALYAYDIVAGHSTIAQEASSMEHTSSAPFRNPAERAVLVPDPSPMEREASVERVDNCGVSGLSPTAAQTSALRTATNRKNGKHDIGMDNIRLPKVLGKAQQEIQAQVRDSHEEVGGRTSCLNQGNQGKGHDEPTHAGEPVPPVNIGGHVRTDKDIECRSVHQMSLVRVEVTEAPDVRALEKGLADTKKSPSGKVCQGNQAFAIGHVKEEIVLPTVSLRCNETLDEDMCRRPDEYLPALQEPIKARTALDSVSMKGFETAEEQAAARQAGMTLWQSIYCCPLDPAKALQGQGLVKRLEILSKTFSEIVADADSEKIVLRTGNREDDIYIGHYRTPLEVRAACRFISRCKKVFKRSISSPASLTLASCGPLTLTSQAGATQVLQASNEQASVAVTVPRPPSPTALTQPLAGGTQDISSGVLLHAGRPASTSENHATRPVFNSAYLASRLALGSAQHLNLENDMQARAHTEHLVQLESSIGTPANPVSDVCTSIQFENPPPETVNPPSSGTHNQLPPAQLRSHEYAVTSTVTQTPQALNLGTISATVHAGTTQKTVGGARAVTTPSVLPADIIVLDDDDEDDATPVPAGASSLPGLSSSIARRQLRCASHGGPSAISNSTILSNQSHLLTRTNSPRGAQPSMMPRLQPINQGSLESLAAQIQSRNQLAASVATQTRGAPQTVGPVNPVDTCPHSHGRPVGRPEGSLGSPQAAQSPVTGVTLSNAAGSVVGEGGNSRAGVPRNIRVAVQSFSNRKRLYNCCMGAEASKLDYMLIRALHCELCDWLMHSECAIRSKQLVVRRFQYNGQEHEQVVYTCNCRKTWGVLPSMLTRIKYILQVILTHQAGTRRLNQDPGGAHMVTSSGLVELDCLKEILVRLKKMLQWTKSEVLKSIHTMVSQVLVQIVVNVDGVNLQGFADNMNKAIALIRGVETSSSNGGRVPHTTQAVVGGA